MLLSLPPDVARRITSEWLCLTSIPRLDTAHCCSQGRQEFMNLAYGCTAVQYHWVPDSLTLSNTQAAQWIALRGVQLNNLVIDEWLLKSGIALLDQILNRSGTSITAINCRDEYKSGDSTINNAMVCIAHCCPNLREVSIRWIMLTDHTLTELVISCPRLVHLEYRPTFGPHLSTRCIAIINEGCFDLEHLVLNNGQPDMDHLPELSEATMLLARSHPKLKSLQGTSFCGISEEALLTIITCCPDLQWLENYTWVFTSWPAMEIAAQQLRLRSFTLKWCTAVSEAQVTRVISHLLHLEELELFNDQVTLEGYRLLSRCRNLRKVDINNTTCHSACLEALAQGCTNLRELSVRNNLDIGDDALLALAQHCPHLADVDFTNTDVSSRGIIALAHGCPNLQRVVLDNCSGDLNDGVVALAQQCPHLTSLVVSYTTVTNEAITALALHCRHLDFLDLENCHLVTTAGLQMLADHCPALRTLFVTAHTRKEEVTLRRMFPRIVKVVSNGSELVYC